MRYEFSLGYLVVLGSALLLGCAGNGPASDGHAEHADDSAEEHHEEEHEGPHGGHVIELGHNHEYHAELVDDDETSSVTVYILDGKLKPLPIEAETVSLNLTVDGEPKPFELAAVDATDGKASQFASNDAALFKTLHVDEATGKLRVTIEGESNTGDVEHHDHDHGDH